MGQKGISSGQKGVILIHSSRW